MTSEELQAIRARCDAATAGPWVAGLGLGLGGKQKATECVYARPEGPKKTGSKIAWCSGAKPAIDDNARFIAHARTDVPALLAEAERLRAIELQLRKIFGTDMPEPFAIDWRPFVNMMDALQEDNARLREQLGMDPKFWVVPGKTPGLRSAVAAPEVVQGGREP